MQNLRELLITYADKYNQPAFIESDPIQVPRLFTAKQDIEIIAFWVAILAWGQRKTIINKSMELVQLMDHAPYDFIVNHEEKDRERFLPFKHRTFQTTDTLYFLAFLQEFYKANSSLEEAFTQFLPEQSEDIEKALIGFHNYFFSLEYAPDRTRKHIATPARKSTCKRLNMFLRWMVRKDDKGVDFGIWQRIKMSQLMIPLDVHVNRVARQMNLLKRKQSDWLAVKELTEQLRLIDPEDPVRFDFALFGLGVLEEEPLEIILQAYQVN